MLAVSFFISHPAKFGLQEVLFLQWYFKALLMEGRAEEATKVARVFTEMIFDQLGQLWVDLGNANYRQCLAKF